MAPQYKKISKKKKVHTIRQQVSVRRIGGNVPLNQRMTLEALRVTSCVNTYFLVVKVSTLKEKSPTLLIRVKENKYFISSKDGGFV